MSIFRCGLCDCYKDVDFHGCNEHPFDEMECICDFCVEAAEDLKADKEKEIMLWSDNVNKKFKDWCNGTF